MAADPRSAGRQERYALEGVGARDLMARRTAASQAAFLINYLRAGMRVIDVGCGGGSITLGLAKVVAPGEVVGVDSEAAQVDIARHSAKDAAVLNIRFEVGNAYELDHADESFDAVLANTLLTHLSDPLRALREFRRLVKPGGVVGVRDGDTRGFLIEPRDPLVLQSEEMYLRWRRHNGGEPEIGASLKRLFREAGLEVLDIAAEYETRATPESVGVVARARANVVSEGPFAAQVVELGWADGDALEAWKRAWLSWADHPDAFYGRAYVHVVGRRF